MVAADVEAVSVAPTQLEGDASSAVGRAGTPEPWVARPESWTPCGVQPKSRAPHGRQPRSAKQATEELRRVGRSDRQPCNGSGQTAWARGRTTNSCSGRGLTA
jgi:hypothetical protein